jgi:multidrug transporter EmrE-like cation transporter
MKTLFLVGCILLTAVGNLLLKAGMNHMGSVGETHLGIGAYILQTVLKPQILVGLMCYVVAMVMWLVLLSMVEISAVYPIFVSAAFVIVMAASVVWLGEHVTVVRILGTFVVALGIFIVSKGG